MQTTQAIFGRYSCRRFQQAAVEREQVQALLQAAAAAPVACGRYQDLRLTVVTQPDYLQRWDRAAAVYLGSPKAHPLYGAPVLILVSVFAGEDVPAANPYFNAGCVVENMALAATDLGLGSVVLAAPVRAMGRSPELLEPLSLPQGMAPALALAVGWPDRGERGRGRPHTISTDWL